MGESGEERGESAWGIVGIKGDSGVDYNCLPCMAKICTTRRLKPHCTEGMNHIHVYAS